MKRTAQLTLDEADISLIKELQSDSRKSMRSLAGKTGLSTPTVASKVQRLIDSGAIKSFTLNLDSAVLGLKDYFVEIRCTPKYQKAILRSLTELRHSVLTQDSRVIGIFSGTEKDASILYDKMCNLKGSTSVALTSAVSYEFTGGNPVIETGARLSSSCYYCRGEIASSPVVEKIGGKARYFCCTSCSTLYRKRYNDLRGKISTSEK